MSQVDLLPEIDREKTKKNVEKVLETTRIYKQIGFVRKEMKKTPIYEQKFHQPTNRLCDPAGDIASWNVDNENRLKVLVERVDNAISRLNSSEREIIQLRYLENEDNYDYIIYHKLGYSERKYYRIKSNAFYKLGYMLRLEIYKEKK